MKRRWYLTFWKENKINNEMKREQQAESVFFLFDFVLLSFYKRCYDRSFMMICAQNRRFLTVSLFIISLVVYQTNIIVFVFIRLRMRIFVWFCIVRAAIHFTHLEFVYTNDVFNLIWIFSRNICSVKCYENSK